MPWFKILVRLALAILLFLAVCIVADLVHSLLPLAKWQQAGPVYRAADRASRFEDPTERSSVDPVVSWRSQLAQAPPITRTMTVSVTPQSVSAEMSLWITKGHSLVSEIRSEGLALQTDSFAEAAFGRIAISGMSLSQSDYALPVWDIAADSDLVRIRVLATKKTSDDVFVSIVRGEAEPIAPTADSFELKLGGMRIGSFLPVPDEATETRVALHAGESGLPSTIRFSAESIVQEYRPPAPVRRIRKRETHQAFLRRTGGMLSIPLVSRLLDGIAGALPLLLFLWFIPAPQGDRYSFVGKQKGARRDGAPSSSTGLKASLSAFLLVHVAIRAISGCDDLVRNWDVFASTAQRLTNEAWLLRFLSMRPTPQNSVWRLSLLVMGVLVPAFLFQRAERASGRSARAKRGRAILWAVPPLLFALGFAFSLVQFVLAARAGESTVATAMSSTWPSYGEWFGRFLIRYLPANLDLVYVALFCGTLLMLVFWVLLIWLYRIAAAKWPHPLAPLLIVLLYIPIEHVEQIPGPWDTRLWILLATGFGVVLFFAVKTVVWEQIERSPLRWRPSRWAVRVLTVLVVLISIPLLWWVDDSVNWSYRGAPLNLAYRLDALLMPAWFCAVLWILFQSGKDEQRIASFGRTVGLLGAAGLMFGAQKLWMYVPLSLLLGWFALDKFVLRESAWDRELGDLQRIVTDGRPKMLNRILDLNAAERAFKALRKKLDQELSSGEKSFQQYDAELEQARAQLDRLRQKAVIHGKSLKAIALAFGPYASAWKNGAHGALWGTLFALPWIGLSLGNFLLDDLYTGTYPFWHYGTEILTILLAWMGRGFAFGYFFAYFRGRNGLEKALGFFAVSVLPILPLLVVYNTNLEQWQASLFWVTQVFLHCMLLGLFAFDLVTLRRGRYSWRMVFEVHGMASVGVSISSILIATGGVITAVASTQAQAVVTLALRALLPQIPTDIAPPPTPTQ